jgi:DNA modification methylase
MNFKNNSFFSSDALTVLERLPSDVVTLTYLDPPHGSSYGLEYGLETKKQSLEELHTSYESYISKVIQQIHRILTYEGSLFVHWSQNSKSIDIRLIINQVFGKQPNYEINWNKRSHHYDSILVYSKSDNPTRNKLYRSPSTEKTVRLYKMRDDRGLYRTTLLITNSERSSLQFNWRDYQLPPQKSWCFDFDKLEKLAQENRIDFSPNSNDLPRLKNYLAEHPKEEIGTVWDDLHELIASSREHTNYPTQKTLILMERIIQLASNEGDQLLDPFCGTGTTLVAAQRLKRNWWGIDNSLDAYQITLKRLLTTNNLQFNKDYDVLNASEVLELPIVSNSVYIDLIKRVSEITKLKNETVRLQQSVDKLTDFVFNIKKQMNISDDDNDSERVEDVIKQIEDWITQSISYQSVSIDDYIRSVCLWLTTDRWQQLDVNSQSFLPQAELLFENIENIEQDKNKDYSPFIIQYCRALENELLIKLFTAYTDDLYKRYEDIKVF